AAGEPPGAVTGSLTEALRARVVSRDGSGTYRFAHDLFREYAYEQLPAAERAALHQRIGGQLEARRARGGDVSVGAGPRGPADVPLHRPAGGDHPTAARRDGAVPGDRAAAGGRRSVPRRADRFGAAAPVHVTADDRAPGRDPGLRRPDGPALGPARQLRNVQPISCALAPDRVSLPVHATEGCTLLGRAAWDPLETGHDDRVRDGQMAAYSGVRGGGAGYRVAVAAASRAGAAGRPARSGVLRRDVRSIDRHDVVAGAGRR